jgi:serine protease Do
VVVKQVFEDLPASKAGLKSGDVVKKFDGEEVANFHAMQRLLGRRKPGDIVPLAVQRGDELVDLQLELGRRFFPRRDGQGNLPSDDPEAGPNVPFVPEAPGPRPWLGAAVELSADGPRLGLLSPEGPAAKAGLKPGDLLLKINGTPVKDATEVSDFLLALPPEATATFELQREGQPLTLEVKLGKK